MMIITVFISNNIYKDSGGIPSLQSNGLWFQCEHCKLLPLSKKRSKLDSFSYEESHTDKQYSDQITEKLENPFCSVDKLL